jgi:hypothetical protein
MSFAGADAPWLKLNKWCFAPQNMTKTDKDDTQVVPRLLTVLYYVNRMGQVCAM